MHAAPRMRTRTFTMRPHPSHSTRSSGTDGELAAPAEAAPALASASIAPSSSACAHQRSASTASTSARYPTCALLSRSSPLSRPSASRCLPLGGSGCDADSAAACWGCGGGGGARAARGAGAFLLAARRAASMAARMRGAGGQRKRTGPRTYALRPLFLGLRVRRHVVHVAHAHARVKTVYAREQQVTHVVEHEQQSRPWKPSRPAGAAMARASV